MKKPIVCAYCRVSTEKDAMAESIDTMIVYYKNKILDNPEWQFGWIYADPFLTGTKDNRPDFQQMMQDARDGKIDIIITKAIERFARNTVDFLNSVRELKSLGVVVIFESNNLRTDTAEGEMVLTIMASVAQDKARQDSENIKWRIKEKMEKGEHLGARVYGYHVKGDKFRTNKEQAAVVRLIFKEFIDGYNYTQIADLLNSMGVKNLIGEKWKSKNIAAIVRNEKMVGDLMNQKSYTADYLSKKTRTNKGEMPKYYVENHHKGIINRETWDKAQERIQLLEKARALPIRKDRDYPLNGKIICGHCGNYYRHKNTKSRGLVWVCRTHNDKGKNSCPALGIRNDKLQEIIKDKKYNQIKIHLDHRVDFLM